jgi:hypothetical protein
MKEKKIKLLSSHTELSYLAVLGDSLLQNTTERLCPYLVVLIGNKM